MSTTKLKEQLINKIRQTEDAGLLEEVSILIEMQETDEMYVLNAQQKEAVNNGRKEIENNEFYTNEQADKEIDEWLKE